MKAFGFLLLLSGLVLAAVPVHAQSSQTTFHLVGKANGGSYAWYLDGAGSPNPDLNVPANTQITITWSSADDVPHTLKVGSNAVCGGNGKSNSDGPQTCTFNSGSANVDYACTIHPDMKGSVKVAGASEPAKKSPGTQVLGVGLAFVGAALLASRRQK